MRESLHIHHICPRHHLGYEDNSPDNLTPLISVRLHAELHHDLYRKFGKIGDLIAWRMLSGQSLKGIAPWNKGKTGVYSKEMLAGIAKSRTGRLHSMETRTKMACSQKGKNTWSKGRRLSEEHRKQIAAARARRNPLNPRAKRKFLEVGALYRFKSGHIPWNKRIGG